MIVDGKGKLFEDRRSVKDDRRKNDFDVDGGRRGTDRRKATSQERNNTKKK